MAAAYFNQFETPTFPKGLDPESKFKRLAEEKVWIPTSKVYADNRRAYLNAILAETNSPVHIFFITTYDFLKYNPTAPPKSEFESLALARGWAKKNRPYKRAHAQFTSAYTKEFGSKLLEFFEKYEANGFFWNPRLNARNQLKALIAKLKLNRGKEKRVRSKFMEAIGDDVNRTFGKDDNDIDGWQYLCEVLGLDVKPTSVSACKKAVAKIYVNIYDLEEYGRLLQSQVSSDEPLQQFDTLRELGEYTFENDLVYPREEAKQGVMKFMLRRISRFN